MNMSLFGDCFKWVGRLLTIILIWLSAIGQCYAQIEIDYSDMAKDGDGFIYAVKRFRPGDLKISDLNRMGWDVSKFTPDSYDTVRYYTKNRSRYGNLFPNAELVKFQTKKNMEFISMDSSKLRMQGIINDYLGLKAAVVLVFPSDLVVYKFPIKVGRVYSDSISKKFVSSYGLQQFSDSVRIDLDMSTRSEFDTCTTIKTPTDTYLAIREKNVVYKKIVAYKNSHLMGWRPAPEFGSRTETVYYRWFAKGGGIAVLEAETDGYDNVRFIRYQYNAPMSVTLKKEDVKCKGKKTGRIKVVVDGGTPDYKYIWADGAKGKKRDSLYAGTYTVTVTDCKGITVTQSITIDEPKEELHLNIDYRNIRCYGDHDAILKAKISGGTSPYYVVWSDDTEADSIINKGTGFYGCVVRDANRCFTWDSVEITAPTIPLTMSPKVTASSCYGEARGIVEFDISGGDEPYTYWLNDKAANKVNENLMAGSYELHVKDKWGCEITRTAEVRQPSAPLDAQADVTHVKCAGGNNGAITLTVEGGTPGYKYQWSNSSEAKDIARLTPGNYYVTITDANNCSIKKTYTVNAPASILDIEYEVRDVSCNGGNDGYIKVNGIGGIAPYTILINNKSKTPINEGLRAGSYDIKVTDKNDCSVIETLIVSQPENSLKLDFDVKDSPCKGKNMGSIKAKISDGKPPYNIVWENGESSEFRSNLAAGRYWCKVTDADKCIVESQVLVSAPEKEFIVNIETQPATTPLAGDAYYHIKVTGGVLPYKYKVSDGYEVPNRQGIAPGLYSATISDGAGCVITKDFEIKTKK